MVNFTCNACGATLRKNQVNKHCETVCKSAWNFTCIDCQKVFAGFEYDSHTSCFSETEKYQGKYLEKKRKQADTVAPAKEEKPHWRGWHKEAKKLLAEKKSMKYDALYTALFKAYSQSDKYKQETEDDCKATCENKLKEHGISIFKVKYAALAKEENN
jgi:cell growth-regulating nucleolar protein